MLDAGWFTDPSAQWETGRSHILHDNVVVIQADVQKGSFLGAFDARTGRELWRVARNDVPTWGTPTVHLVNGQTQIVNGWRHTGAYDLKTGREIWKLTGGGDIPVPTPVVSDGKIYVLKAGPMFEVLAENDMTESVLSTPAISEGALLYRTQSHVMAIRAAR